MWTCTVSKLSFTSRALHAYSSMRNIKTKGSYWQFIQNSADSMLRASRKFIASFVKIVFNSYLGKQFESTRSILCFQETKDVYSNSFLLFLFLISCIGIPCVLQVRPLNLVEQIPDVQNLYQMLQKLIYWKISCIYSF